MKPRLSRSLQRILAGVVVCSQIALAADLDWAGTSDNFAWNTTSDDWVVSGTTTNASFTDGDNVTFVASPGANVTDTVDVNSDIDAGQVVINDAYTFHTEEDATVSGEISGTGNGALTKTGAGALTLNATAETPDSTLALTSAEGELVLAGTNTYSTGSATDDAQLTIAEDANITFTDVVELSHFSNSGTLNAEGGLTIGHTTEQGGTVNTPSLTLEQGGNVFTSITTDLLQVNATDASTPVVTTTDIAPSTEGNAINVKLSAVNRAAENVTIVDVTGDTSADTTYTLDPETQALYRAAGFDPIAMLGENGSLSILLNRVASDYYHTMALSPNAVAGTRLVEDAFLQSAPQWNRNTHNDLAKVMDRLDSLIAESNLASRAPGDAAAAEYDRLAATVAGAGVASLGIAWRTQMERQLRSIRDRMSVMKGGISCCKHDPKAGPERRPCFTVWANGDIDYQNQQGDTYLPGFKLHGIGGTVGMAGRLGNHWILGGAVSGMSGRISSKGYGSNASGDLDSYYASIFTRFDHGCWSHSLTGTVGLADVDFKRRVDYGTGTYETKGTPDGLGLGIMYEVARSFRISEDYMASAWWQPVANASFIHSRINSFTESGSDAALHVEKQEYNNAIISIGARMQTVLGRRFFNTDSVFNLRVLGKGITGSRRGKADVSFASAGGASARVATSERGALGVEVGGGIAIPLGHCGGNIFAECTAEFMKDYNSVNGVLGYRIGF